MDVAFSDHRYDTFTGAPQSSDAAEFETQGVDIRATRPVSGRRSDS